ASCANVPVNMLVRGICCIKAGVKGYTENVHIHSIVGRYLEHSRVYAFGKGDRLRVYIASGDFLTRNTERRVEVGVRIKDKVLAENLYRYLDLQWHDTVNSREMQTDGTYVKIKPQDNEKPIDSQTMMYDVLKNAWNIIMPEQAKAVKPKRITIFAKLKSFFHIK
ncbi:MAG: polyphosphate kinase 1, partial [Oscillospiraceae bacterium]